MATANSTGNLITMTAINDTARTGIKIKVAGVIAVSSSVTAAATVRLRNGASSCDIIPYMRVKSGMLFFVKEFRPPIEVVGLKATNCTNANITIQVE